MSHIQCIIHCFFFLANGDFIIQGIGCRPDSCRIQKVVQGVVKPHLSKMWLTLFKFLLIWLTPDSLPLMESFLTSLSKYATWKWFRLASFIMEVASEQSLSKMIRLLVFSKSMARPSSLQARSSASRGLSQDYKDLQAEKKIQPSSSRRITPVPPCP
jgi:hypothetical protein